MRTLGVNGVSDVLYLAFALDGEIVDVQPYSISEPAGLAADQALVSVRDEVVRLLGTHNVNRVRVLDAEPSYSASYAAMRGRLTLEAIVLLASAEARIDARRLSRAKVKSLLGLPKAGSLGTHVGSVVTPVGKSWSKKRDLAALVALAGEKE
jgi:hypothetical protein